MPLQLATAPRAVGLTTWLLVIHETMLEIHADLKLRLQAIRSEVTNRQIPLRIRDPDLKLMVQHSSEDITLLHYLKGGQCTTAYGQKTDQP